MLAGSRKTRFSCKLARTVGGAGQCAITLNCFVRC
jgi:hypothetical protein